MNLQRLVVFVALVCSLCAPCAAIKEPQHEAVEDTQGELQDPFFRGSRSAFVHLSQLYGQEYPKTHHALLPLSLGDFVGLLLAAVSIFLAAGGGIGGGGVLVPVLIIAMHFTTKTAVALSNLTIAGGALANLMCNLQRRHPTGHKPLIDWDLILVMEPMTICGAVFGGYLNKLLPVWFTAVAMSVMLLLMSVNLWKKALSLYERENANTPSFSRNAISLQQEPLLSPRLPVASPNERIVKSILGDDEQRSELRDEAARHAAKRILVAESHQVGLVEEEGDIHWTTKSTVFYPAICSLAGLVAGLFGVGGGIVKGPLLLEMGVLPEVAAATSATMILFTTGAASVVYITFGGIPWDYASTLVVMGFSITIVGQLLTYSIIHHFGRRSVIVFAMATLLSMGCVIMWYESFLDVRAASHSGFFHFGTLCGRASAALARSSSEQTA